MILITGATGALGPSIIWGLYKNGFPSIKVFALDKPEPGILPEDIKLSIGNISNFDDLSRSMENIEAVIHMAAFLHINNPTKEQIYLYKKINVDGTENVVRAALKAGAKRIIFFSTISIYGSSDGRILNEDSEPNPLTPYAKSKLEAEQIVLEAKLPNGQPIGTVLRLAAAYGSRVKGNYLNLLHAIAKGWFIPIGQGKNRRTLIYDKDVANAVVAVLRSPLTIGRIYNVTDGHIYSMNEVIETIYKALGKNKPSLFLPIGPVKFCVYSLDNIIELFFKRSFGFKDKLEKYMEDIAVDGLRLQKETDFRPRYNLLNGWKEAIAEMRERGEL
jgi:UDP-glucose 4-epimerase